MARIWIDDEFAVWKPPRQIMRVFCRNHAIIVAICNEHRLANLRQIRWLFRSPKTQRLQLRLQRRNGYLLVAIVGRLFDACKKLFAGSYSARRSGKEQELLSPTESQ